MTDKRGDKLARPSSFNSSNNFSINNLNELPVSRPSSVNNNREVVSQEQQADLARRRAIAFNPKEQFLKQIVVETDRNRRTSRNPNEPTLFEIQNNMLARHKKGQPANYTMQALQTAQKNAEANKNNTKAAAILRAQLENQLKQAKQSGKDEDFKKAYENVLQLYITENPTKSPLVEGGIGDYQAWKEEQVNATKRNPVITKRIKNTVDGMNESYWSANDLTAFMTSATNALSAQTLPDLITNLVQKDKTGVHRPSQVASNNEYRPMTYKELTEYMNDPVYKGYFERLDPLKLEFALKTQGASTAGEIFGRVADTILTNNLIAGPSMQSLSNSIAGTIGKGRPSAYIGKVIGNALPDTVLDIIKDTAFGVSQGQTAGEVLKEIGWDTALNFGMGAFGEGLGAVFSKGKSLDDAAETAKAYKESKALSKQVKQAQEEIQHQIAKLGGDSQEIKKILDAGDSLKAINRYNELGGEAGSDLEKAIKKYDDLLAQQKKLDTQVYGNVKTEAEEVISRLPDNWDDARKTEEVKKFYTKQEALRKARGIEEPKRVDEYKTLQEYEVAKNQYLKGMEQINRTALRDLEIELSDAINGDWRFSKYLPDDLTEKESQISAEYLGSKEKEMMELRGIKRPEIDWSGSLSKEQEQAWKLYNQAMDEIDNELIEKVQDLNLYLRFRRSVPAQSNPELLAQVEEAFREGTIQDFLAGEFANDTIKKARELGIEVPDYIRENTKAILENDSSALSKAIVGVDDFTARNQLIGDTVQQANEIAPITKKTSNARTIEEAVEEIGEDEALSRILDASISNAPLDATVTVNGKTMTGREYVDGIVTMLPDDETALNAMKQRLSQEMAEASLTGNRKDLLELDLQLWGVEKKGYLNDFNKRFRMYKHLPGSDTDYLGNALYDTPSGRLRGFIDTLLNGESNVADDTLRDIIAGKLNRFYYTPQSNQETLDLAKQIISTDDGKAELIYKFKNNKKVKAEDAVALRLLLEDAYRRGDYDDVIKKTDLLARAGTDTGRTLQSFSLIHRYSPEGVLNTARGIYKGQLGKGQPEALDKVVKELKQADDNAMKEAAQRAGKELDNAAKRGQNASEALVKRIETAANTKNGGAEVGQTRQMVNDLYAIFQEKYPKQAAKEADKYKLVADAVQNRAAYREAWDEARNTLTQKYANDPDMFQKLNDFLLTELQRSVPENRLASVLNDARKKLNMSMSDLVDEFYSSTKPNKSSLIDYILEKTGVQGEDAEYLRRLLDDKIIKQTEDARTKALAPILKKKENQQLIKKISADKKALKAMNNEGTASAKRFLDNILHGGTEESYRSAFAKAYKLPELDAEQAAVLTELAMKAQGTTGSTNAAIMQQIYENIAAKLPVTRREKVRAYRYMAMLANPKTHLRNMLGNKVMFYANKVSSVISQGLERGAIKFGKMKPEEARKYFGWSLGEAGSARKAAAVASLDDAMPIMQRLGKFADTDNAILEARRIYKTDWLEKLRKTTSGWLEAEDASALRHAYVDSAGQIMAARGVTEITDEIMDDAIEKALELTFRSKNAFSSALTRMKVNPLAGWVIDTAMPFTKTPSNIALQAYNYSPIALAENIARLATGKGNKSIGQIIDDLGKSIVGTPLAVLGGFMGYNGIAHTISEYTGKKGALSRSTGEQDFSVQFGPFNVSMDSLLPTSMPFFMGAAVGEALKNDKEFKDVLIDSVNILFEASFLQSLSDIMGSGYTSQGDRLITGLTSNYASQMLPTMLGSFARIDPIQRASRADSDGMKFINTLLQKIPLAATFSLEPTVDMWGNEMTRIGAEPSTISNVANAVQQFANPLNTKYNRYSNDPATQEVLRLEKELRTNDATPPTPSKQFTEDGVTYAFNQEQFTEYSKELGQRLHEQANAVVRGSGYRSANDEEKAKMLKKAYEKGKKNVDEKWKRILIRNQQTKED